MIPIAVNATPEIRVTTLAAAGRVLSETTALIGDGQLINCDKLNDPYDPLAALLPS